MNGWSMATCPTFSWGRVVSTILVDSFIRKEKFLEFWFLLVLGTRRRKEMPKKQKKNERRRTEKKEKLENTEERVKIRFVLFISFLFCGLSVFWDCIFGFVVRMRDKMKKFNKENGTTLLLFLIFSNFGLTREIHETWPRFSKLDDLTTVRTVHCIFGV